MARHEPEKQRIRFQPAFRWLAIAGMVLAASGCSRPSTLDEIRAEGVLHVITRTAPSIYFEGRDGPTGFEYELAKRFADELGVKLRVRVVDSNTRILSVLDRNYAHIGLAGLALNPDWQDRYQSVPNGLTAQSVVVYNRNTPRPEKLDDLAGQTIHVVADSNHIPHLEQAARQVDGLNWRAHPDLDAAGILKRLESGEFSVAVIDSNELAMNHVFFPDVKQAFSLDKPENITWLFPSEQDQTLVKAARKFFQKLQDDGTVAQLKERFYGHLDRLNYVGARTFVNHIRNRLPQYETLFQDYAAKQHIDWRLLAAIGYQESHWRPNAKSPTGVRGLMMLTRNTADYIGIDNRLDAAESIQGGARYFNLVHDKIPDRIPEPDRTWFALASYNVGFGHLEDARKLTESAGKDPDRWMDVKKFLPLLAQKEWYSRTEFGYARGNEPVAYVQNIRRYYDVLVWMKDPRVATDRLAQQDIDLSGEELPLTSEPAPADKPSLPKALGMTPPTL